VKLAGNPIGGGAICDSGFLSEFFPALDDGYVNGQWTASCSAYSTKSDYSKYGSDVSNWGSESYNAGNVKKVYLVCCDYNSDYGSYGSY